METISVIIWGLHSVCSSHKVAGHMEYCYDDFYDAYYFSDILDPQELLFYGSNSDILLNVSFVFHDGA